MMPCVGRFSTVATLGSVGPAEWPHSGVPYTLWGAILTVGCHTHCGVPYTLWGVYTLWCGIRLQTAHTTFSVLHTLAELHCAPVGLVKWKNDLTNVLHDASLLWYMAGMS